MHFRCEPDPAADPRRSSPSRTGCVEIEAHEEIRLEQTRAHYRIEYRGGVKANIRVESRHTGAQFDNRFVEFGFETEHGFDEVEIEFDDRRRGQLDSPKMEIV
jgi:hypothetical protein